MKLFGDRNVGGAERVVRTGLGIAFILGGAFLQADPLLKLALVVVGIVALVSGCAGSCIFYTLLGMNSKPGKK